MSDSMSPEESYAELLSNTSRAARRSLHLRLGEFGVRGGNWYALKTLFKGDGLTQRELGQRIGMTDASVVDMLRGMEKEQLIERRRDPQDQRKIRVYLTDRARELREPLSKIAQRVNDVMLEDFSEAEALLFRILLKRIHAAVQRDQENFLRDREGGIPLEDRYF